MLFFRGFHLSGLRHSRLAVIFHVLSLLVIAFFASNAFSAELTLAWDPNTEPDIAGYRMHYGTSSGNYPFSLDVGNHTTCVILDIEEGRICYFAVTAYDIHGNESDLSDEVFEYVPQRDTDGDGIPDSDETGIYGTDPNRPDTDEDGINDGDEIDFWAHAWNMDADADGIVNLLDWDSDNDGFSDGWEKDENSDPSDPGSIPPVLPVEIGEVSLDHNWTVVELQRSFVHPVVIAKPLSLNGNDPAVIRIRNVDSNRFEIRLQEWDYMNGTHSEEMVSFLVMEQGRYTLEDGTLVAADTFDTNRTSSCEPVSFGQTFATEPVIMAAITSFNGADTVTGRIKGITTTGFQYRMQEQEGNSQVHGTETISYIAWEPSSGVVDGLAFEVQKTPDVVTHTPYTINFDWQFTNIPLFFADMQTTDGGNTANLRWQNKDVYGIDVKISEEQSSDIETGHTTEVVGYIAFASIDPGADTDNDGLINGDEIGIYGTNPCAVDTDKDGLNDGSEIDYWGNSWDADYDADGLSNIVDWDSDGDGFSDGAEIEQGFDPGDHDSRPAFAVETGEINVNYNWKQIAFDTLFFDPVVVAKPMSSNDDDPAVVRIRNVNSDGFEIRIQKWNYLDAEHAGETVSYIVLERGTYTLEDGTLIEAGTLETNNTSSHKSVSLTKTFTEIPVVIAAVTSFNESDAVTGRIKGITTTGFQYRMQEQESNSQVHGTETISYIAWEPSSGVVDGLAFEAGKTPNVVTDTLYTINFDSEFTNIPSFFADMQTTDGGNTANIRWQDKNTLGVDIYVDEEESGDTETSHTTEVVGYIAFHFTD